MNCIEEIEESGFFWYIVEIQVFYHQLLRLIVQVEILLTVRSQGTTAGQEILGLQASRETRKRRLVGLRCLNFDPYPGHIMLYVII